MRKIKAKHYTVRNLRIPADLDDSIIKIVEKGDRYQSISQFVMLAIRRLVTFEEGEMRKKLCDQPFDETEQEQDKQGGNCG